MQEIFKNIKVSTLILSAVIILSVLAFVVLSMPVAYGATDTSGAAIKTPWCYRDADGDGYGNSYYLGSCNKKGYVSLSGDCNDNNAAINPKAKEVCDKLDNNCDGKIDEGVTNSFYRDVDGDGYGSTTSTQACTQPTGYVSNSLDCNDGSATIKPGATEICGNGIDEDCSGADLACPPTNATP